MRQMRIGVCWMKNDADTQMLTQRALGPLNAGNKTKSPRNIISLFHQQSSIYPPTLVTWSVSMQALWLWSTSCLHHTSSAQWSASRCWIPEPPPRIQAK
jgi:hypothetical protein